MSASGIKAGQAFVEFTLNDAALVRGLNNAQKRIQSFGNGLASVGTRVAGLGLAVAAPLIASAKSFASYGKGLSDVAARTNVSASALSELGYAAKQTGSDLETLESGLRNMQQNLLAAKTGSVAVQKTLKDLGLTIEQLSTLAPEKQFEAIAAAMAKVSDPAKRLKSATEIFGKSAQTLFPLISGGAAAIAAFRREAGQVGAAISEEDVRAAAVLDDAFGKLSTTVTSLYIRVGAALAPALNAVLGAITPVVQKAIDWLNANQELVVYVARAAAVTAGFGAAMLLAGKAVLAISAGIKVLTVAYAGLKAVALGLSAAGVLNASYWVVLAAGIAYFGKDLLNLSGSFDWLASNFTSLVSQIGDTFDAIAQAFARGDTEAAAKVFWTGLELIWQESIGKILSRTTQLVIDIQALFAKAIAASKSFLVDIQTGLKTTGFSIDIGIEKSVGYLRREAGKAAAGFAELGDALASDLTDGNNLDNKITSGEARAAAVQQSRDAAKADKQAQDKVVKEKTDAYNKSVEKDANRQMTIEEQLQAQLAQLEQARQIALADTKKQLEDARRAFDAAKTQAKGDPQAPDPNKPPEAPATAGAGKFDQEAVRSAVAAATPALFGGALAGQVFGVGDVQKQSLQVQRRLLEKQDKQIEVLRKIEAKSEPLALK